MPPTATTPGNTATTPPSRLTVDAPTRAFHWLFALSFAGAWLTAESERWRGVHETLGYAFGGLLLFRLVYGLVGPKHTRLSLLWRRATGWREWLSKAQAGRPDLPRALTLGMGMAMLLLLAVAAPLVLSGHAGQAGWWGLEDALEELHELFANTAMALVLTHVALIGLLSVVRRRNLAAAMVTGRTPGPGADVVKARRGGLALLIVAAYVGSVGWLGSQLQQVGPGGSGTSQIEQGDETGDRTSDGTSDGFGRDDDEAQEDE